ncbi:hypothetical protein ACFPER_08015 [Agromyces aurantiacus]|uniref:DUF3618 domain-containing protein n=1 Tax=Agromyces aurantiacus TaxID=165814 RepID=A0ABV9R5I9_9MICO|nr:hypothetical protein [Agromyces aurantiacus]MBM7503411.1 ElaB/YqjD/DUF883 family membrane-anchored ribosome-binding protein [Agromyces aurantiacus]
MVNTAGTGTPDLKQEAGAAGHRVADTAKQEARSVASEAKYQARRLVDSVGSEVRSQASTQQHRAAGGIRDVGSQFSEMAATSGRSGMARDLVETVGARADSVATWLDQREPQDLLEEVKRYARRRPGVFLAIAAGAGIVIGRLTRSLATPSDSSSTSGRRLTGTADTTAYPAQLPDTSAAYATTGGVYPGTTGTYAGTDGAYTGTGDAYGTGAAGSTGAHVAEPDTTWAAEPTGVTGTEPPYTEPFPGEGTGRGDVTGAP